MQTQPWLLWDDLSQQLDRSLNPGEVENVNNVYEYKKKNITIGVGMPFFTFSMLKICLTFNG